MNFEQHLRKTVQLVRDKLAAANVSRMCFKIEAEGRVEAGDLILSFSLGRYGDEVKGGDLDAVVEEFLRREGWDERYAPLCLPSTVDRAPAPPPYVGKESIDDEIPF